MTRKDPVQGHRERLLSGAVRCLQERGYARTTARDLVAASGTNLASIGYHFGGKDALLNAALAEGFRLWTTQVEEAVFAAASAVGPRERLEVALRTVIGSFDDVRPLLAACVEAFPAALHSGDLRDRLAAIYDETRARTSEMIVRACTESGLDVPGPPRVHASVLIALIDGLMLQWLLDPSAIPAPDEVIESLSDLSAILNTGGTST